MKEAIQPFLIFVLKKLEPIWVAETGNSLATSWINYVRCGASTDVTFISTLTLDTVPTQAVNQWEPEAVSLASKLSQRELWTQFYLILNVTMREVSLTILSVVFTGVKLGH
jgi:hypothetical protein